MTRSHPPTLTTLVRRCLLEECGIDRSGPSRGIVLGVSGGPDSLALCDVMNDLRGEIPLELVVASVDHGLRAEAAAEVALVRSFCESRQLPFHALAVDVAPGGSLQARARSARYAALRGLCRRRFGDAGLLATAHHMEDRAETVLLRLLRGVSVEGLAVLPPRSEDLVRPMIRAHRGDVLLHCRRRGLEPVSDPSNDDPRFLRTRVRSQVLPLLEELSPGVVASLCGLADDAARLGEPLGLNREQRKQLRLALLRPGARVDLPLPAGLRLFRDAVSTQETHPGEE